MLAAWPPFAAALFDLVRSFAAGLTASNAGRAFFFRRRPEPAVRKPFQHDVLVRPSQLCEGR